MVDDEYLNGYAKIFSPTITAVYLSLCRHADKEQSTFPSQDLIAEEHNLNARTVRRAVKTLVEWKLVTIERERTTTGKWLRNTYYLLDKKEWKPKPETIGHPCPVDKPEDIDDRTIGHQSPLKDTHLEGNTLNTSRGVNASGITSLKDILSTKGIVVKKSVGGATHEWQDRAVRYWQKLGLKGHPDAAWFKIFKTDPGIAERACNWASDSGGQDLRKLTFWGFNQFRKNGKITFPTTPLSKKEGSFEAKRGDTPQRGESRGLPAVNNP